MINTLYFRIATVVWALSVAYLSLTPTLPKPVGLLDDKIQHFAAYALLSLLVILSLNKTLSAWKLALLAALYGGLMEVLQTYAPGRSPEWLDLVANTMGVAMGLAVAWVLTRTRKRSLRSES